MKKSTVILIALLLTLCFTACDTPADSGTESEKDAVAGQGSGGENGGEDESSLGTYQGNYVFNPPTDHYHIKLASGDEEARVGDKYTSVTQDYTVHADFAGQKLYTLYEGTWYNDTNLTWSDFSDAEEGYPAIWRNMEDGLIALLRAFGTEEEELGAKLKEYYVGDETVCGVTCWVFDSKGINANYCKYWVDPANGLVLKTDYYRSDGYIEEIVEYDLDYTTMDPALYPADYENVGIL